MNFNSLLRLVALLMAMFTFAGTAPLHAEPPVPPTTPTKDDLSAELQQKQKAIAAKNTAVDLFTDSVKRADADRLKAEQDLETAKAKSPTDPEAIRKADEALTKAKAELNLQTANLNTAKQERAKLQASETELAQKVDVADNKLALGNPRLYEQSLKALTILFVVAVLLENALAVLFHWRVFQAYFSLSGVRTPIMFLVSAVVVFTFKLDVVGNLIAIYKSPTGELTDLFNSPSSFSSKLITALILAGGSAGINNLMKSLGYRKPEPEDKVSTKPGANKGWVAVRVRRDKAVGDLTIKIHKLAIQPAGIVPIAGTIRAKGTDLASILLRNKDRFPANEGYAVDANIVYEIIVEGYDANKNPLPQPVKIAPFAVEERAIVDFDVTL